MPFYKQWRDFQKGDLFYGLANPRHDLILALSVNPADLVTIDQYALCAGEKNGYGTVLMYDWNFLQALYYHKKYWTVVGQDMDWGQRRDISGWQHVDQPVDALAIAKRKCKGGLHYITRYTLHHIHFCLDGLNMLEVPSKSYAGGRGAPDLPSGKSDRNWLDKVRSITGAELRWVYRNRRDPRVRSQIQFWFNHAQCPPPWEPDHPVKWRTAWAAYHPAHEWYQTK